MRTRLFDEDPLTGAKTLWHHDEASGQITHETIRDVEPVLEHNKDFHNSTDERARWKGDMHRVASLPLEKWMELKQQGIIDDERAFRRWLDDPENAFYRTRPGKLSR